MCITFGNVSKFPNKQLTEYGFKQIIDEFSIPIVASIQQKIKESAVIQLEMKNVRQTLDNRRIAKKEEFKEYYDLFLTELKGIKPIQRSLKIEKIEIENNDSNERIKIRQQ